jgi:mRNA-degrading endonuclease RelE of RelBE toxin-antitoxin system
MEIIVTEQFEESYDKLTGMEKQEVHKLRLEFEENTRQPGLRIKKMAGWDNIWEARASNYLRLTFQMSGNAITLRHVGQHDSVLNHP